jgi:hypothetical protein
VREGEAGRRKKRDAPEEKVGRVKVEEVGRVKVEEARWDGGVGGRVLDEDMGVVRYDPSVSGRAGRIVFPERAHVMSPSSF